MGPIRVGFIGLGAKGWARGAHLPYLKDSGKYAITAICNTSVDSAKNVIELYGLPSSTKAYGNPEDIAKDADVDLVIVSVRVDRHYAALAPALKAGKNVVVEWPLAKSAAEARSLLSLKNSSGVKKANVILQARRSPLIYALKNTIQAGTIGRVLSSTWTSCAVSGGPTVTQQARYLGDKEVGGNLVTIHLTHAIDYVSYVLGWPVHTPQALFRTRRDTCTLMNDDGTVDQASIPKTADDTMFVTGELGEDKVPVSWNLLGGEAFPGTPGLEWRIYGEKGTLRVVAGGPFLQIGYDDMKIEVQSFEDGSVKEIEIPSDEFDGKKLEDFPYNPAFADHAAKNMSRLYKHLAEGGESCSWESAVELHELIEELYKQNGYTEV